MNYTVDLGCWGSIFAVPTDVVDKYLKIAGSAQLKVLLYILRNSGKEFSAEDIAAALNMDAFDVKDCIEFWSSFGVIAVREGVISPAAEKKSAAPAPKETAAHTAAGTQVVQQATAAEAAVEKSAAPVSEPPKREPEKPSETVAARPLRPDPIYIAKRISEDKEIESLLNEAQFIFARPVSPNENAGIIMLHDNEGLPSTVILMLLTYGVSNNKGMRQIETMGAAWAREGITTVERADEKIRQLEDTKNAYHTVQSLLGLEFRKASDAEGEMYNRWINVWKFNRELIKEAYDICVNSKGKYIPKYVNTILSNWYDAGIKTVEQARANRRTGSNGSAGGQGPGAKADTKRRSSFDIDELSSLSRFND